MKLSFKTKHASVIHKIGFGTWGLGGDAYGSIDSKKAKALIRHAYENGIRVFDTSPLYGDGKCEEILGDALEIYPRDSFKIITKAGLYKVMGVETRNFRDDFLLNSLQDSCSRLRVSYVDYFMLHSPNIGELETGRKTNFGFQNEIQNSRLKRFGVSVKSPNDIAQIQNFEHIAAIEFNFSLMDQRFYQFSAFTKPGCFKIARTPYNFGFLTSSPPPITPPKSSNNHLSNWQQSQFDDWHRFRSIWNSLAIESELHIEDLALTFILSEPKIDLVIPGFMEFEHIDHAIRTANRGYLDSKSMNALKNIYTQEESEFRVRK